MDDRVSHSHGAVQRFHALYFLATVFGAGLAVPLFYKFRMSDFLFVVGLVGFIGVPVLLAVLNPYPSQWYLALIIGLLAACPAIYFVMDHSEKVRDAFFLMTGINILFVSTTWAVDSARSHLWSRAVIAAIGIIIATGAVYVMLWMYLYFE